MSPSKSNKVWDITPEDGPEEVELLEYDGDKYCKVRNKANFIYEIKSGYLFSSRLKAYLANVWFGDYSNHNCPRSIDPNKYVMTRKEYAKYRKDKYKKRVSYAISDGFNINRKHFRHLNSAITFFKEQPGPTYLELFENGKFVEDLASKGESGEVTIWFSTFKRERIKGHRL